MQGWLPASRHMNGSANCCCTGLGMASACTDGGRFDKALKPSPSGDVLGALRTAYAGVTPEAALSCPFAARKSDQLDKASVSPWACCPDQLVA